MHEVNNGRWPHLTRTWHIRRPPGGYLRTEACVECTCALSECCQSGNQGKTSISSNDSRDINTQMAMKERRKNSSIYWEYQVQLFHLHNALAALAFFFFDALSLFRPTTLRIRALSCQSHSCAALSKAKTRVSTISNCFRLY